MLKTNDVRVAPVSIKFPLISNQDAWMNIGLIKQYHANMPKHESQVMVFKYLHRLGIEHIAFKRTNSLSEEEAFCAMLLRAAMLDNSVIVIDRPFKIIPHLQDVHYIYEVLEQIDDLYSSCQIYDYQWMAEKYGDLCS